MKSKIKAAIFIIVFCVLFNLIIKILWMLPTPISEFYKEQKDTIDIMYIGSSNVYMHFNPVLSYNLYGYTTGMLSANTQPLLMTKYMIEETKKTQNPSLYIIDLVKVAYTMDTFGTVHIRNSTDSMKLSKNRTEAINDALSYKKEIGKDEYINYYFSFLFYHNSWKNIRPINITRNTGLYKGFLIDEDTTKIDPQEEFQWEKGEGQLAHECRYILEDLISYIKSNNLKVLFVIPIRKYDEEMNKGVNEAIKIIEANNFEVLNFNTIEEFENNIDYSNDFYNYGHLNIYGATKYTLYFSKYLKEHYDLPDHRNDEKYVSWDEEYENFKKAYKKETNKEFDDLLYSIKK